MKFSKIFLLFVCSLMLSSCFSTQSKKEIVLSGEELTYKVDSLNQIVKSRDSIINTTLELISYVSDNLDEMKRREGMLLDEGELKKSSKEKLNSDLEKLSLKLDENRKNIARLERLKKTLNSKNIQIAGIEKMISKLRSDIDERETQIKSMSRKFEQMEVEISNLNTNISSLKEDNQSLTQTVIEQKKASLTRYYIVGNEKQLISKGIIKRVGGLSRELKLNPNLDYSLLQSFNINDKQEFELNCRKAVVVGNFPTSSYSIERIGKRAVDKMVITNIEEFWKGNVVLVIATK